MREPWERYLNDVVSHVRFAFDRRKIRQELAEHMEDLYEDLLSQDIDEKQAAELTVDYMGDSEELGKELDKAHHPVLGYVWLILGILCIVVAAKTAFGLLDTGVSIAKGYFAEVRQASYSEVVYMIPLDIEKEVYSYTIYIDKIVYYEDGMMEVDYATWRNPFSRDEYWTFEINACPYVNGTPCYDSAGSYKDGRFYGKGQIKLKNVPEEADRLQIWGNADLGRGWAGPIDISLPDGQVME
ncbi:permease prefix domain 1-containing protein [Anaerotignum sp.]|uniref:permease prefix domain 1-containing protein n=1 Tax=Anaerotignum sp. TaxID=2039241 RepID=UPI002A91BD8D|nr:permease prefix domain 1-containing protein [Anaerotignum sp.]MCI7656373.1 permease prefix domain 1-containing protein [Clostridia bacterium]MDY5414394.1 permease prefix domain 1-containing protein [Anaerotignum sp.]